MEHVQNQANLYEVYFRKRENSECCLFFMSILLFEFYNKTRDKNNAMHFFMKYSLRPQYQLSENTAMLVWEQSNGKTFVGTTLKVLLCSSILKT